MKEVEFLINAMGRQPGEKAADLDNFNHRTAQEVQNFHRSLTGYSPSPLHDLTELSRCLGLGRIWLKDESRRFGLNAFKVLGGSYAMGRYLAEKIGTELSVLGFEGLRTAQARAKTGILTFVTATDGNHGRGVAWTAKELGHRAVVFMPKGSAQIRADNIRATGAQCHITELNYDDAVRLADSYASEHGGVMVQDTAWEGYKDIPLWIMQGYMTLTQEILDHFAAVRESGPTHVFLQAGVGSFAGAVLGRLTSALGPDSFKTVIVEPHQANCYYRSFLASDGSPKNVGGQMETIMAGLACGEPSILSWPVIRDYSAAAVSCADHIAANGMRILAAPKPGDPQVISGESGAVTAGVLEYLVTREPETAASLGLGPDSKVLLISTEGDTSPGIYRQIVWYGQHPDSERKWENA
ncbi:MAG: diaminopropionate ammonia-lyase [Deltaproteobacteria bacterium]|jgi:diaminopropionate ammonia-lyase|nr:diaminopropionate ammonia-lyase [Deltaproteobacteria bacterium]